MDVKNACWLFGHRDIPEKDRDIVFERLCDTVKALYSIGVRHFITGGAWGFDTMSARAVYSLKEQLPEIKLIMNLPYIYARDGQPIMYRYSNHADRIEYASRNYVANCFRMRNDLSVSQSAICVCYITDMNSSSASALALARENKLPVINLAF